MLNGHCHCGNVSFSVGSLPATLTECNCSICHRYGARWAYYKPEQVTLTVGDVPTQTYRWGDEMIDFHHCPQCGCLTHYTGTGKDQQPVDRIALNSRMFPLSQTADITVRHFDGAQSWTYLD